MVIIIRGEKIKMKNIIGNLIEIHNRYLDSFEVGKVVVDNKDYIIIKAVDPNGEYDGYSFNEKREISKIKSNGKYLDFMNKLQNMNADNFYFETKEEIISYAIANSKLLYVTSSTWCYYKIIKPIRIQEKKLTYHPINYYGKVLEEKSISIDLLFHIEIDTKRLNTFERYFAIQLNIDNSNSKKLIEVYEHCLDKFNVGEIQVSNPEFLLMKSYNSYGEYDGYIYQEKKTITKIKSNSNYLKFLEKVILENDKGLIFDNKESILELAFNDKRFVSISYGKSESYYDIKILSLNKSSISFQIITQTGQLDKEKTIKINKINYLKIDSVELRALERIIL